MRGVTEFMIGAGALICVTAFGLSTCGKVEGATLRIVPVVPTVQGQREAGPYDPGPLVRHDSRPSSRVLHVLDADGAPPNGCPSPAFRVVSGPRAQRGCYGAP